MALVLVLLVPAAAALLAHLAPPRWAWPATMVSSALVLALAARLALLASAPGAVAPVAGGLLACDALGALILLLVAVVAFTAALFSRGYLDARAAHAGAGRRPGSARRYYVLYNLFVLSLVAVPVLADIALVWFAIALTTLLSAFLVGFEDTPEALEAAWKYVVLTTLGAVLALLGFLILFWAMRVAGEASFTWTGLLRAAPRMAPELVWPGFALVLVGLGTKAGVVPMHTWLPDAHSQAPAPICALLSGVETSTALYAVLRLLPAVGAAPGIRPEPWLLGFGLASVGVAALLLVRVRDFKRLFAFSTVEHMGIVLVAAGIGGAPAHFGATYQLATHAFAKSLCFLAAGIAVLAVGGQEIANTRGLIVRSPVAGVALLGGGLAIAGAPPFAVFVSEIAVLRAGVAAGEYLVVGLLAFFVVLAFCAIVLHLNAMAFGEAHPVRAAPAPPALCVAALALAAVPVVVLGVHVPAPLAALLHAAAAALGPGG